VGFSDFTIRPTPVLKLSVFGVVDVIETNIVLCLNNVHLDHVILNDTDTFIDSVDLFDVTETGSELCLSSVGFPSIILNNTGTPIFIVKRMASSTR
jgi:hypothetical protein